MKSLKEFTPDMAVMAIVTCLEAIRPAWKFPKQLPQPMTVRLKLATSLVEAVKELGFRGDIGYQSVLYFNEIEIRRVLMFLIERLPKEGGKIVSGEDVGYVPDLIREIRSKLSLGLEKPWIPAALLEDGARECGKGFLRQSFGWGHPLLTVDLKAPKPHEKCSETEMQYWARHLQDVTNQCSREQLLPSLLFKDNEFTRANLNLILEREDRFTKNSEDLNQNSGEDKEDAKDMKKTETLTSEVEDKVQIPEVEGQFQIPEAAEQKIQNLREQIEAAKEKYTKLQEEFRKSENKLSRLYTLKEKEDAVLKDVLEKVKIKSKTAAVLSKEENLKKLKNLVMNSDERMRELTKQWTEAQTPLLEQYRSIRSSLSEQELKNRTEKDKMSEIRERNAQLGRELKDKEKFEQQLAQECSKMNKNTNRSAYTKRILEIIGNIKKQNDEIQKVLRDTKDVQKEISNLTGQLQRSFTLSDELIFRVGGFF